MLGRKSRKPKLMFCSFCGKDSKAVNKLIAGPTVFICDECVGLCNKILDGKTDEVPPQRDWDKLPDDKLLKSLAHSSAILEDASDFMYRHVGTLRKRGVKWAEIGKALGIYRQAAWERFS